MRRHSYADDPELLPSRSRPQPDLPIFAGAWPESPPARDEQTVAPIAGTIRAAYDTWRQTPEGELVYRAFCREALDQVSKGAVRLSGKAIAETIRTRLKRQINNSHIALLVRDCEAEYASTRRFEKRRRAAT